MLITNDTMERVGACIRTNYPLNRQKEHLMHEVMNQLQTNTSKNVIMFVWPDYPYWLDGWSSWFGHTWPLAESVRSLKSRDWFYDESNR